MTRPHPLLAFITEIRRRPGTQKEYVASMALPGLALSTSSVPDDAEVSVDLVLESIPQGVSATGTVTFPWVGECRRCLGPVEAETTVEIREIFETSPVEGETWPLGVDTIDLEPVVRETVLLALPLAPLCGPDCRGPVPEAFPAQPADALADADDVGDAEDQPPPPDERWAALDQLKFD